MMQFLLDMRRMVVYNGRVMKLIIENFHIDSVEYERNELNVLDNKSAKEILDLIENHSKEKLLGGNYDATVIRTENALLYVCNDGAMKYVVEPS